MNRPPLPTNPLTVLQRHLLPCPKRLHTNICIILFLSLPGPCLRVGARNLPDSRSCLQIGWLHCLLLHSARRHAPHILPHRPFAGPTTAEPGDDRKRRLGQWLARASAHSTYVLIYFARTVHYALCAPSFLCPRFLYSFSV